MNSDDDRISYLAGDPAGDLDADEQAELDEFRALLADPSLWVEPAIDLEARIVSAIAAEAQPPVTARPPAKVINLDARRRRVGRIGGIVAAVAAAAIVVVALAVVRQDGDQGTEVALAPTQLVPGASGSARVFAESSGLRIELNATGLPRRDGGLYYQAWLKDAAGNLVPIGTFHDGDHVTLWAGVALADFPTLTVTEEQADNDQGSSGRRVLLGTVETK
ncbi:MAG: anti-sigma factor [Acidimicrobiales bacterium]